MPKSHTPVKTLPESDSRRHTPQKNILEWMVFVFSAALVLGTLGYLIFSAATQTHAPPLISVRLGPAERAGSQFRVPIVIANDGDRTAEGVQVEVVFNEGEPNEQKAGFTANYLPRRSQRSGAVLFTTDPHAGTLQARVLGYENP